jgi:hypothetical protein
MVDFSKRLVRKNITKRVDPVELYDTLDRASDKGELRTGAAGNINGVVRCAPVKARFNRQIAHRTRQNADWIVDASIKA